MTAWLFGTVPAVLIGGVGTVLVALAWMRLFPALRKADSCESNGATSGPAHFGEQLGAKPRPR